MKLQKSYIQLLIALFIIQGISSPLLSAPKMEIIKNGQPNAVIVIDAKAPNMVTYAARELQTYLEKSTGAKLSMVTDRPASGNVIYVGESKYTRELNLSTAGLKLDGFKIITGNGWLALFGMETEPSYTGFHPSIWSSSFDPTTGISRFGQTGSLYAVYRFLEKQCGIHFYMPGELGEVVPKTKSISIGSINYNKSPDISYRNIYYNEFSYGGNEIPWFRRAGLGAPYPVSITHSFLILNKYASEHPEYFSIIDGERDFHKTSVGNGSLCLTNPGTLKAFVNEANKFFDEDPGRGVFPVMPNDGWDRLCECPDCQKYNDKSASPTGLYSEYVWEFVNKVAKEIEKTHPGKMIGCCAYANYLDPPKHIDKLNPNVAVMICKTRVAYWDKAYQKKINAAINTWKKKSNHIFVWEYYLAASGYELTSRGLPIFFPTLISHDLKHLKNTINGEFIEGESWVPYTTEKPVMARKALITPNFYITGKLYWDTSLNPEKLMDEYCRDMYGPAEKELRTFWTDSESLWMTKGPADKKDHSLVYTPEAVNSLMSHLKNGLAMTSFGSLERKRIQALIADVEPTFSRINNPLLRTRPKLSIPHTSQPPVIDGSIDDECWKNAVKIDFCDHFGNKAVYNTYGLLTWDEKNLYLAFVNTDPNPTGIVTYQSGKDADFIWDDEVNELFFREESAAEGDFYQFIINAAGTIWDAHWVKDELHPTKWDSNCTAKTAVTKDGWILETSIPLSSMGLSNLDGKKLTANFYRSRNNKDIAGATRSCWSPNVSAGNYAPDRFGYMIFKK